MGVFDQASHYALKSDPAAFFGWRIPRFVGRFTFVRWLDTTTLAFPGEPDRVCDTVAEFVPRDGVGPRRLLDVECQSEPDPDMLERLGEYAYRLRRGIRYGSGQEGKYRVIPVLLTLTGREQPNELDMREADLDDDGPHLRVVQVTFSAVDAATILARIAAGDLSRGLLPWVPLMRGGDEDGIMAEWRRLASEEPVAQRRADYGGLALVFAELAGRRPAWHRALEGWDVKESQQVLEWQAQARREADLGRARQDILTAIEVRLHTPVPVDLAATVAGMDDINELSRWFRATLTAANLEAFRAAVGQAAAPSGNAASGNGA